MLLDEQSQIISKVYGLPENPALLPMYCDRTIVYKEGCTLPYEAKASADLLDYVVDMMHWLEPGEDIIGVMAWTNSTEMKVTTVLYAPTSVLVWVIGGEDGFRQKVSLSISTSLGKVKLVEFIIQTTGTAPANPVVTASGDTVTVSTDASTPPAADPEPILLVYPTSLSFEDTAAVIGETSKTLVVKNDGTATAYIRAYDLDGAFFQTNNGTNALAPGEFIQLTITFKPQTVGTHIGSLSIDIGDGLKQYATFTGSAIANSRLVTAGNQLVTINGDKVRLKSINWFGAETTSYTLKGLNVRGYRSIIDQIAALGFNSIRIPFSGDICNTTRQVAAGAINYTLNASLSGKTAIQVLDAVISYASQKGLYVILAHQRGIAGDGAYPTPNMTGYTIGGWHASWLFLAERYKAYERVIGADLHNAPSGLNWEIWANYAEDLGNAIHGVAPHWLIFVEGIALYGAEAYWNGGELAGVADRPITLAIANRLVYAVHEYGASTGAQSWLAKDSTLPAGWPFNLYSAWREHWGFIFEQNIAPVWICSMGGKFGVDGNGVVINSVNAQYERQWIYHLQQYMAGYFTGSTVNSIAAQDLGISFAYFAMNPTDTNYGGILQDDWTTAQAFKLELIAMMLNDMSLSYLFGLTPLNAAGVTDASQLLVSKDGHDYAVTLTDLVTAAQDRMYEIGVLHYFDGTQDPNTLYTGQTWVQVADLVTQSPTVTVKAWRRTA